MDSYFLVYSKNNAFPNFDGLQKTITKPIFDSYCCYYKINQFPSLEGGISKFLNEFRSLSYDAIFVQKLLDSNKESLFVFDMDSTLIQEEVIDEIAKECGVYKAVSKITEEAMQGMWNFEESLRKRCSFLKGIEETVFNKVYNRLTLNVGVKTFLDNVRKYPVKIAVLSGGFTPILEKFAKEYKIHEFRANALEIQNGKLTGNLIGEILDGEKKQKYLLDIASSYNIPIDQVVAVGDGANDKKMIETAGIGIGFHAKLGLKKQILNYVDYSGLEILLSLFQDAHEIKDF